MYSLFSISHLQVSSTSIKQSSSTIEDIYDGSIYQALVSNGVLADKHTISFKHNTDVIAVFTSSGKYVWPIFLQINELPSFLRYILMLSLVLNVLIRKKTENEL